MVRRRTHASLQSNLACCTDVCTMLRFDIPYGSISKSLKVVVYELEMSSWKVNISRARPPVFLKTVHCYTNSDHLSETMISFETRKYWDSTQSLLSYHENEHAHEEKRMCSREKWEDNKSSPIRTFFTFPLEPPRSCTVTFQGNNEAL